MTPTHKYPNGRPVTVGELCLAELDDSAEAAAGRTLSRPAAGRVTRLLDDDRIEIAIAPNGYPVIASTRRALSLEDIDSREYKEPVPVGSLSAMVAGGAPAEAPAPQEDPALKILQT